MNKKLYGKNYFFISSTPMEHDGETYWNRIEPSLMESEEYFKTIEPREEWQKRCEEGAAKNCLGIRAFSLIMDRH